MNPRAARGGRCAGERFGGRCQGCGRRLARRRLDGSTEWSRQRTGLAGLRRGGEVNEVAPSSPLAANPFDLNGFIAAGDEKGLSSPIDPRLAGGQPQTLNAVSGSFYEGGGGRLARYRRAEIVAERRKRPPDRSVKSDLARPPGAFRSCFGLFVLCGVFDQLRERLVGAQPRLDQERDRTRHVRSGA